MIQGLVPGGAICTPAVNVLINFPSYSVVHADLRDTHTHAEKPQLRLPATYKKAEAGIVESAPTVTHNFELFCVYLEK